MQWIRWSSLAALVLVVTSAPVSAQERDPETVASLLAIVKRDAGDAAWNEAIVALRAAADPDVDARLARVLLASRRDAARRHRLSSAKIDAIATRSARDGLSYARKLEQWDAARSKAREWIFDETHFPDVDRPVLGPETGHAEAERRGQAARRAFRPLAKALDRASRTGAAFFPERFAEARMELAQATLDWARLANVTESADDPPPPGHVDGLARALDAIAREEWTVAVDRIAALPPGWNRLRAWHAWCRSIRSANERKLPGLSRASRKAIAELNDYRMALGIPPLRHHAALLKMANAHALEMHQMHYFSHESPLDAHETPGLRARAAGYRGRVHECLSLRESQASAIVTWRYDGSHHRDLLFGVDVGLSERAPWTFNVGGGDPAQPRPPHYAK